MIGNPHVALLLEPLTFGAIFAAIVSALFNRLKTKHLGEFDYLGRPHILRHGFNAAVLSFILGREHRKMGDNTLSLLSDGVLATLIIQAIASVILLPYFTR
ncbi:hypothetical protein AB4851_24800 [Burkholderia sp. 22PA0099]|uniref:hypothetical protein n=1 Tax=Burkholderia sp. 22PA0099 TaxID=3237372 RepID=UPI0039C12F5D